MGDQAYAERLYPALRRTGSRWQIARALAHAGRVREDLRSRLAAISIPTTVVVGEDEPLVSPPPPAANVFVVGRGHNPQLEQPAEIARLVSGALSRHPTVEVPLQR